MDTSPILCKTIVEDHRESLLLLLSSWSNDSSIFSVFQTNSNPRRTNNKMMPTSDLVPETLIGLSA